jgi:hypothetical protein
MTHSDEVPEHTTQLTEPPPGTSRAMKRRAPPAREPSMPNSDQTNSAADAARGINDAPAEITVHDGDRAVKARSRGSKIPAR